MAKLAKIFSWQNFCVYSNIKAVVERNLLKYDTELTNKSVLLVGLWNYSGTLLNGHPSAADTCDITDNSECPDCISIDFNTFKTPQQQTPRYYGH